MEAFLESARRGPEVSCVDFSFLEQYMHGGIASADEVKECVSSLIDSYASSAPTAVYQQAIMKALSQLLDNALHIRKNAVASKQSHGCSYLEIHLSSSMQRADGSTSASSAMLGTEDYLLLAMFFSDLSTIADPVLFYHYCEAVATLMQLALPLVYLPSEAVCGTTADETEVENKNSLKAELTALRSMIVRRLTSTVDALQHIALHRASLRVATNSIWTLLSCVVALLSGGSSNKANGGVASQMAQQVIAEVEHVLSEMMAPLVDAVEDQVLTVQRAAGALRNGGAGGAASPLILCMVLRQLEDVLWGCGCPCCYSACGSAVSATLVSNLLLAVQRYLALQQQHRQTAAVDAGAAGGEGAARRGGAGADTLRVYSVQRGLQRLISIALSPALRTGFTDTICTAAAAAVAAFGGCIAVTNPFACEAASSTADKEGFNAVALHVMPPLDAVAELHHQRGSNASGDVGTVVERWSVHPTVTAGESQVRECCSILASAGTGVSGGMPMDGEEYIDGLEDDDEAAAASAFLHGGAAPLRLSSGLVVSATALVEMVMRSVAALDLVSEDTIHTMHVQGLEGMQYVAAKRAQREELERQRRLEQQGVEAIPAGELLDHVKDTATIQQKGATTLRRVSARAKLERAAFSSVLASYDSVKGEAEGTVREAQALIARCLVQLPASLADSAVDDVLLRFRKELATERQAYVAALNAATVGGGVPGKVKFTSLAEQPHSYYQLVLQVLFTAFASMAPFGDRAANQLLLLGALGEGAAAGVDGGTGAMTVMRGRANFFIDTDSPIAFLQDDDTRVPSYAVGRKRGRMYDDEQDEAGSVSNMNEGGADEEEDFCFGNDTAAKPCAYSHIFCRVIELIEAERLPRLLVDCFKQAPALTRYVWSHLYRIFCLSKSEERCQKGFVLLTFLAIHRPVYRACAVNLLLHVTMSSHDVARRMAIKHIRALLSRPADASGVPVIDAEAESLLVRYAKKQLLAVLALHSSLDVNKAGPEAMEKEERRLAKLLDRHLGFFLMLCALRPRELFSALLDVFKQCVDRNSVVMVRLIPRNADIHTMIRGLLRLNAVTFVSSIMPTLRRYCVEATTLVQTLLRVISVELDTMMAQAVAPDGPEGVAKPVPEELQQVALALVGHGKAMFERSSIPLNGVSGVAAANVVAAAGGGPRLHDIRFLTPFLRYVPTVELTKMYLRSFLYFVQTQLQVQHQRVQQRELLQQASSSNQQLSCSESSFLVVGPELDALIAATVREVSWRPAVSFSDGVARGLSPVDLFVYLHLAPRETEMEVAAAAAGAADGARAASSSLLPPIDMRTTIEVVRVCVERLGAPVDVPKLFTPAEVQEAVDRMMRNVAEVPAQLMYTVIRSADAMGRDRGEFVQFVVKHVLEPLKRASAWQAETQLLWRGVLLFAERYYRECSTFLVTLPDKVLTDALRERPHLQEAFRSEHGNNASFGHILGDL